MNIKNIFVIGAGTMGNGIAQVAATSGYQVTCMDVQPTALEKAKAAIQKSSTKLFEKGAITAEQKASTEKIHFATDMTHIAEADLVIEASSAIWMRTRRQTQSWQPIHRPFRSPKSPQLPNALEEWLVCTS